MDTIMDFDIVEDTFELVDQGSEQKNNKLNIGALTTLTEVLNLAAAEDGSTDSIINWFEFQEATYLVQDLSANTTFDETKDIVVQIQGIVDLETINTIFA